MRRERDETRWPVEPSRHGFPPLRATGKLISITELHPLDDYRSELLAQVRRALAEGVEALEVSGAVADAHDALVSRLIVLAEQHLGPPPLRYRWLALGSHGRREQVLSSDQDHTLAHEQPAPGAGAAVHGYFRTLAGLVVPGLARAGMPLCPGGYMATTWCQPIDELERMFRSWVEDPQPAALIRAEVFLDIRGHHGDLDTEVLDRVLERGGRRGPFRAQLARAAVTFRPPRVRFGPLRRSAVTVDTKLGGTAAIVLLARLYALAAGSKEHATVPRLEAAAAAGTLGRSEAAVLGDAYRFLTDLRLRHQVRQVDAGMTADNLVRLADLTDEQRHRLRETLDVVRDLQDATAMRFCTHAVM